MSGISICYPMDSRHSNSFEFQTLLLSRMAFKSKTTMALQWLLDYIYLCLPSVLFSRHSKTIVILDIIDILDKCILFFVLAKKRSGQAGPYRVSSNDQLSPLRINFPNSTVKFLNIECLALIVIVTSIWLWKLSFELLVCLYAFYWN